MNGILRFIKIVLNSVSRSILRHMLYHSLFSLAGLKTGISFHKMKKVPTNLKPRVWRQNKARNRTSFRPINWMEYILKPGAAILRWKTYITLNTCLYNTERWTDRSTKQNVWQFGASSMIQLYRNKARREVCQASGEGNDFSSVKMTPGMKS